MSHETVNKTQNRGKQNPGVELVRHLEMQKMQSLVLQTTACEHKNWLDPD